MSENCSNEEFLDDEPDIVKCPICKQIMMGPTILTVGESDEWYDCDDPLGDEFEPYDDNKDYGIDQSWKEF